MRCALVALLAAGVVGAADPKKDDPSKKDLALLQGDWACEAMTRDGFKFPDDDAQALFRTTKGNAYTVFRFSKKVGGGTFKLDASKTPKTIDATPEGPKGKVKPILGIYKLEKGRLTFCFAEPGKARPTAFDAKEGSGHTLSVWVREKKE